MTTEVSTQLSPKEAFEQKITERLRQDIGDLMPDEVLSEMVKKSIQDTFFIKRQESNGYGGSGKPVSWLDKEVKALLQPQMDAFIKDFMLSNDSILKESIVAIAKDILPLIMGEFFVKAITNTNNDLAWSIGQRIKDAMAKYNF